MVKDGIPQRECAESNERRAKGGHGSSWLCATPRDACHHVPRGFCTNKHCQCVRLTVSICPACVLTLCPFLPNSLNLFLCYQCSLLFQDVYFKSKQCQMQVFLKVQIQSSHSFAYSFSVAHHFLKLKSCFSGWYSLPSLPATLIPAAPSLVLRLEPHCVSCLIHESSFL